MSSATVARESVGAVAGSRAAEAARLDRGDLALSALLGAAATAVSASGSGTASLWGDEAASVLSAQRSAGSLFAMALHVDGVHALYYAALHLWMHWAGVSPFAVRFPSAVAIGVAVATLYLLGRRLRGRRFGILAAVVAAILPRLTDVGSEARSYAFTAAFAVILSLILVTQLQSPVLRRSRWVAYGVVVALGTLLFLWLALVAVAQLIVLLAARPAAVLSWLKTFGWAMVGASPVVIVAAFQHGQIAYLATRQKYDLTAIAVTPWFENHLVAAVAWPLVLAGLALAVRAWWVGRRHPDGAGSGQLALIPVLWMLVPGIALIAASPVISVYTPRYLAMCAPAVALLIAWPVDVLLRSAKPLPVAAGLVAIGALLASIVPVWSAQRTPYAKNDSDWSAISAVMAAHASPGDAVAFDDATWPSRRTRLALRTYPAGFAGLRDVTLRTPYFDTTRWYDASYTLAQASSLHRLDGVTRLWLIEYAIPGHVDTTGIRAARADGFHELRAIRLHRSEIIELVRG